LVALDLQKVMFTFPSDSKQNASDWLANQRQKSI
jgi:hypothetical protein